MLNRGILDKDVVDVVILLAVPTTMGLVGPMGCCCCCCCCCCNVVAFVMIDGRRSLVMMSGRFLRSGFSLSFHSPSRLCPKNNQKNKKKTTSSSFIER
jgi:hypothetical protein